MKKKYVPLLKGNINKKAERLSGRLSRKTSFSVVYNIDKLYFDLYCKVLERNNIPYRVVESAPKPIKVTSFMYDSYRYVRAIQYTVYVDTEHILKYLSKHSNVVRKTTDKKLFIYIEGANALYPEVLKDFSKKQKIYLSKHPELWG